MSLPPVRSGVELGLGLRRHVCLIVSFDLGVLRLGSARCLGSRISGRMGWWVGRGLG